MNFSQANNLAAALKAARSALEADWPGWSVAGPQTDGSFVMWPGDTGGFVPTHPDDFVVVHPAADGWRVAGEPVRTPPFSTTATSTTMPTILRMRMPRL